MGSLYEPSIRSSTWSVISKRLSRRFTTLEGWREIGMGVYAMGSSNIRMFSTRHQFDPEHSRYDDFDFTTPREAPPVPSLRSYAEYRRSSEGTIGKAIGSMKSTTGVSVGSTRGQRGHGLDSNSKYTRKEKWTFVAIAGAAAIFPALTFNVYLPALARIATDLRVSLEAVNLTIMLYLLAQAVAPIFWVPLSDTLGRRPVYLYTFILYTVSSTVLSFSPNIAVLFVFRGLQSVAVASTVAVGCAVIQDIWVPSEREHVHNVYQSIRNVTLVVAPVLGGVATNYVNFRCIFVILFALSLTVLAVVVFFLPETLPSIAGNGTMPLTGIYQPLIWRCGIFGKPAHVDETAKPAQRPKLDRAKLMEPFRLMKERDIVLSLVFGSVVYAIWMMMTVSTVGLFRSAFGLNDVFLGLALVPNAIGTITGSALIGNLLNQDFVGACCVYRKTHALPKSVAISRHRLPVDFPLEHTRLLRLPGLTVVLMLALSFYGFTLYYPSLTSLGGWIAIPLLLQFVVAAMAHAICGIHQTLVADLWPWDGSAAAAATSNLVRCTLAGVGVAVVQKMLEGVEVGATFLALALVVLILVPLPIAQWFWGGDWRRARDGRVSGDNDDAAWPPEKV